MKTQLNVLLALSVALAGACRAPGGGASWSQGDALASQSVELEMNDRGGVTSIEYHVTPELVPQEIHDAMNALYPDGEVIAGEREMSGGDLHWELSKRIDGLVVEAMFDLDGNLVAEEAEIPPSTVPEPAQAAVRGLFDGRITKWEAIRDADRELVEYHAKVEAEGRRFKVAVDAEGTVRVVVREVPAEIEVPLPTRD